MFIIEQVSACLRPKENMLALGTDTRQRVSFSKAGKVFDVRPENDFFCSQDFYEEVSLFLYNKVKLEFSLISFDPHPLFACNTLAESIKKRYFPKARLVPVWHHIAHVASFGLQAPLNENFIGVAFDGTGYGQDHHVWGGEFFIYKNNRFFRAAHFQYQPLCGNELAIKEPWRFAFGVLYGIYGLENFPSDLKCFQGIKKASYKILAEMIDKNFNTPYVSSVGRLFDAVGALLNLKAVAVKEAEVAIAVEKAAACYVGPYLKPYDFRIVKEKDLFCVDPALIFQHIVRDLRLKVAVEKIAYRFHNTLAEMTRRVCVLLSKEHSVKNIYFSGGVFMNNILLEEVKRLFEREDLKFYFALRPFNTDLGIARGQISACLMENLCV